MITHTEDNEVECKILDAFNYFKEAEAEHRLLVFEDLITRMKMELEGYEIPKHGCKEWILGNREVANILKIGWGLIGDLQRLNNIRDDHAKDNK